MNCSKCGSGIDTLNNRAYECKKCHNKRKREERARKMHRYQWTAIQSLGGECEGCGIKATEENMVIFDFHHIHKDTKVDNISNLLAKSKSLLIIMEEASKCILFCSNCHRLHHKKHGY